MSEIAVVSVKKIKLTAEAQKGNKLAAAALKLAEQPERFLSTIQVGITLIGILTGVFSGEAFADDIEGWLTGLGVPENVATYLGYISVVVAMTYLSIVFGELVPKRIGMCAAERVARLVVIPVKVLSCVGAPFVWILAKSTSIVLNLLRLKSEDNKVTEEEIRMMVQESATAGGDVQEVERNIVERVFNLGDRNLESIMTPRSEMRLLHTGMSGAEVVAFVNGNPFDNYPVIDVKKEIIGFVAAAELIGHVSEADFSLEKYVHEPVYFPKTMKVYHALEDMKRNSLRLCFVCDEFGETKGIVTLRDILEALVGTIQGLHEKREIAVREDGSCLVDGQYSFYDFLVHYKADKLYAGHDYNTLGGLILDRLGHIPVTGERLQWQGFSFEVMDMDGGRIDKVSVRLLPKEEE